MRKLKGNRSGFTLIELIVVMIIIGILVLLATPRFIRYIKDANATSLQVDAKTVADADLYQNLNAYSEAGYEMESSRGQEYAMKDIVNYDHKIFTEKNGEANIPDFGGAEKFDFNQWKLAVAGSFQEVTGYEVLKDGEIAGADKAKFEETNFAAVKDDVLASHIRNTRFGVNNFMVATDGRAEGEAYYMGYVLNGDDIMYVSLIPSGVKYEKNESKVEDEASQESEGNEEEVVEDDQVIELEENDWDVVDQGVGL